MIPRYNFQAKSLSQTINPIPVRLESIWPQKSPSFSAFSFKGGNPKRNRTPPELWERIDPAKEDPSVIEKGFLLSKNYNMKRKVQNLFLSSLSRNISHWNATESKEGISQIEVLSKKIQEENISLVKDPASETALCFSSLVYASYRILCLPVHNYHNYFETAPQELPKLEHYTSKKLLKTAVFSVIDQESSWLRSLQVINTISHSLQGKPNPNDVLFPLLKTWCRTRGEGFSHELLLEKQLHSVLVLNVRECFYYNFFKNQKMEYLTKIFCSAEQRLMEDLAKHASQPQVVMGFDVNFQVKGTLPTGQKECTFEFESIQMNNNLFPTC